MAWSRTMLRIQMPQHPNQLKWSPDSPSSRYRINHLPRRPVVNASNTTKRKTASVISLITIILAAISLWWITHWFAVANTVDNRIRTSHRCSISRQVGAKDALFHKWMLLAPLIRLNSIRMYILISSEHNRAKLVVKLMAQLNFRMAKTNLTTPTLFIQQLNSIGY